jgi:hypothetical protein
MTGMEDIEGFDEDEDFFEEDEPLEKVLAAFRSGEKFITGRPLISIETHGLASEQPGTAAQLGAIVSIEKPAAAGVHPIAVGVKRAAGAA